MILIAELSDFKSVIIFCINVLIGADILSLVELFLVLLPPNGAVLTYTEGRLHVEFEIK